MGVPGFFKWLAQRYPLICEAFRGSAAEKDDAFRLLRSLEQKDTHGGADGSFDVPDGFDNLYLDVNGIIHNCSHSIEDLCAGIKCEEDIFVLIFQYINNLVKIVQPRKMLYLAIDGVAPMAKIIQQRDRRFRSARDAKRNEVVFKSLKEQQESSEDPTKDCTEDKEFKFDAIQITPGTAFMQRLTVRLQHFAQMMIHENKAWKHLKIVVSGSEVPGEGEHKIMEYIRNEKTQRHEEALSGGKAKYISHCIYGLDADLIMLSLVTHEPYVCLLREQVYFNTHQAQSRLMINMDDYIFMHVGILREYLVNDMIQSEELRNMPSTADHVIDDFVFITMFMGNDFLPHGKFSKIPDGGINAYLSIYSRYVTERYKENRNADFWLISGCGEINLSSLMSFLGMLAKREVNRITGELYCGPDDARKTTGRRQRKEDAHKMTVIDVENVCIDRDPTEFNSKYGQQPKTVAEWKSRYYLAKMGISNDVIVHQNRNVGHGESSRPVNIDEVVHDYLEAIQWVMYYYYRGVPSWSWYLRCRYAPLLTDVMMFLRNAKARFLRTRAGRNMADMTFTLSQLLNINFGPSAPITPFEQLMMVLPTASAYLLPSLFGKLMTDLESPLRKYYPDSFDIDMDDTHVQWGGVTLLPVVPYSLLMSLMNGALMSDANEKFPRKNMPDRKLHYMESLKLTEEEKLRNSPGVARVYFYNSKSVGSLVKSPLERFKDIEQCKVDYTPFFNPVLRDGQTFMNQLMMHQPHTKSKEASSNRLHANLWFPSLSSLPYTPFTRGGVHVFHMKSHFPSLYLWVRQPIHRDALLNLLNAPKAKYVLVGYPYKHIGRLESIHTPYITIEDGKMEVGKPYELREQLASMRRSLEKKGIILSHRCPDPALSSEANWSKMSSQFLVKLLEGLPGCSLSPNLPSVRQAKSMGIDHVCENVLVKYRVLDINLQDTTQSCQAFLPFVKFVNHIKESIPQMKRTVFRDQESAQSDVTLSNHLNEMIALKNTLRQHERLYGKYSKPSIKAICIMEGSLYGCVGTVDTVGNSFDEISAVFPVSDFRITIAESALQKFSQFNRISQLVEEAEQLRWYNFPDICKLANISERTALFLFNSVTVGAHHEEIGMRLAHWDEEHGCIMCLPEYTRCSEALLCSKEMSKLARMLRVVEYSELVLDLVKSYRDNYQELFTYLKENVRQNSATNDNPKVNIPMDKLFPESSEEVVEFKKGQLMHYINAQPFRRLKLTPGRYECLTQLKIAAISQIYDEDGTSVPENNGKDFKLIRVSHIKNLHIPSYSTGSVFVREEDVYLGQSVIYINHNETVPLGTRGTVVGIYPQNADGSNRMFELVLEKTFVGASHLFGRCSSMRGLFVVISDIMPVYSNKFSDAAECFNRNQSRDRSNAPYISYV